MPWLAEATAPAKPAFLAVSSSVCRFSAIPPENSTMRPPVTDFRLPEISSAYCGNEGRDLGSGTGLLSEISSPAAVASCCADARKPHLVRLRISCSSRRLTTHETQVRERPNHAL